MWRKKTESEQLTIPDPADGNPVDWENYSWSLLKKNDYVKAVEVFQKALRFGSDKASTHRGLAYSLSRIGREEEALPHLLKAVELNEKSEDADAGYDHRALAWYYERKGRHEAAEQEFEKAPPYTANHRRSQERDKAFDENIKPAAMGALSLWLSPFMIGIIFGIIGIIACARSRYQGDDKRIKMIKRIGCWGNVAGIAAGLVFAALYIAICIWTGNYFPWWLACILGIGLLGVGFLFRDNILQPFFKKPTSEPRPRYPDTLVQSPTYARLEPLWHCDLRGIVSISISTWDDSGQECILAVDKKSCVHILNRYGHEIASVQFPVEVTRVECGRVAGEKRALLGLPYWGRDLIVVNPEGEKLWSLRKWWGINGAHWGDINGDGADEVIVGLNGVGGFLLLDQHGRRMWKKWLAGPWSQSILPARQGQSAIALASLSYIHTYSERGKKLSRIGQKEFSITSIRASFIDQNSKSQVAAFETIASHKTTDFQNYMAGFGFDGTLHWRTPCDPDLHDWRRQTIGCGDLDGDGLREWVFARKVDETIVCSHDGKIMAKLKFPIQQPEILTLKNAPGILVVLAGGTISAYVLHSEELRGK